MPAVATDREVRRALTRVEAGKSLNQSEVVALLEASGEALEQLLHLATQVRDRGLAAAGRSGVITYSPKVFIPLTHLCRDRCRYCTFVTVPGRLTADNKAPFMAPDEVLRIARQGAEAGCLEALFTLGDRPEARWPVAKEWLASRGYESTLEYVRAMAIMVLEETGLLPHLNPGVMSWQEMARLKPVAPSMGMMLETTSRRLFEETGGAHFGSPDKDPEVRLRVLEDAGRLSIPFTTGLLLGIGEDTSERADSLLALKSTARRYGHIQEVIVQNFRAKPATAMQEVPDLDDQVFLATVATSRLVLGESVRLQAPPNLSDRSQLGLLLRAGVDDWGGVSPVTADHVNPERPWPHIEELREATAERGLELLPRLTVHPKYVLSELAWIDPRVRPHVQALADPITGLARSTARPVGLPWQEPETTATSTGRINLHADIDTVGRTGDRRGDFTSVYGDWEAVAQDAETAARAITREAPAISHGQVARALSLAAEDPASLLESRHDDLALALMTADGPELDALCDIADQLRAETVGDVVTYVVNRNINFTNVCYVGCRFCAFAQRKSDPDAYTLSLAEIGARVREAVADGATEICMQGGIDPDLPADGYFELAHAVKAAAPEVHLHAFSPMEVMNGVARTGMSIEGFLRQARDAGLDTIPGTAAEILDDEVRWVLTKGKLPTAAWIEVVSTAHRLGIRSTATMMYGHVDHPRHWLGHLRVIAQIQDETGGFTEFVPLPFIHTNSPVYLAGVARPGPTKRDNRAVHAMARVLLHGRIDNIQTSWVKLGAEGVDRMLRAGANDLGGTLMEETISRMAGSKHGSAKSVAELREFATGVGRVPRQRTTTYELLP
jgi:FO synthase